MSQAPPTLRVPMNDLARGIARDRDVLQAAFDAVLDSGQLVLGPQTTRFEEQLAALSGVEFAVGVASGTDALELAIRATMPEGRRVVLTAANAGGYTSTAARRAGFDVRYADVDPVSLCLSAGSAAPYLDDGVGVVVVTHLYGNLTDIRELVADCHSRGILVVEDCAQAIGASLNGRPAGGSGDAGTISFYPTKNLGAVGDGGAIVTSNSEIAERVTLLRQYGWQPRYRVAVPGGVNSRLDELQAAFLLARLDRLPEHNARRRSIIARYEHSALGGRLLVLPAAGEHHSAHLAVVRTDDRDDARGWFAERGISTDIHFPFPDHEQPGFEAAPVSLPETERASREVFSLPCFPELTDAEIEAVCDAIKEYA